EREKKLKRLATSIGLPMDDVEIRFEMRKGGYCPPGKQGRL
ncbi:unnamed protein product, partial [marine sediment metagenome]